MADSTYYALQVRTKELKIMWIHNLLEATKVYTGTKFQGAVFQWIMTLLGPLDHQKKNPLKIHQ